MLEHVIEYDEAVTPVRGEVVGEESNGHIVTRGCGSRGSGRIGLDTLHRVAAPRGRFEEPTVSASRFETLARSRADLLADDVEDPLEVLSAEIQERFFAALFVDRVIGRRIADMRRETGCEKPAGGTAKAPRVARGTHARIADNA
jgi:hypothetical protein